MPLIRSDRTDRRRRVMREAVAADAEVAIESVRARQRRRSRDRDTDEEKLAPKRDPGYSQAVRRACQQRLVQLIPVRRSRLILAIAGFWAIWAVLVLAHYFIHVKHVFGNAVAPIAYLVHLRSTHGIAHWLGSQLWMLTALVSLMIFQLRRHKLDDYRARYRVWGLLAIAALISSLDVSSSGLYLFGTTIDAWARREVGYSGWSVVLATFATLVGLLGLRICSEIKSAPMSVTFWMAGLIAWAVSALIGTKLLEVPWSSSTTDLVVGSSWLGGILAVFLAAGIYLRHIYIEAQKRFILRNGMLVQGNGWRLPRFSRRNRTDEDASEEVDVSRTERESKDEADDERPKSSRSWFRWKRRTSEEEIDEKELQKSRSNVDDNEPQTKRSWLRLPRWSSDPTLGDDYSDVSSEHRRRDEGFREPYGKKRGWFAKKDSSPAKEQKTERPNERSNDNRQRNNPAANRDEERDESIPDFEEVARSRKSWWKSVAKVKPTKIKTERNDRDASSSDSDSDSKSTQRRWFQLTSKNRSDEPSNESKPKAKREWSLFKKRSTTESKKVSPPSKNNATDPAKPKRKLFGFFDSLKLKPPTETKSKTEPVSVTNNRAPLPSSSMAQRNEPAKPTTHYGDNRSSNQIEDDDFDDDSTRHLSKAERKRLRRQQQENRRAA